MTREVSELEARRVELLQRRAAAKRKEQEVPRLPGCVSVFWGVLVVFTLLRGGFLLQAQF